MEIRIIESYNKEYILKKNDTLLNINKFGKENNILFITGISGSGKTFTSNEYAKVYNAEIIHLDELDKLYGVEKGQIGYIKFKNKILEKFPLENAPDDEKLFNDYMKNIIKFLIKLLEIDITHNYIVEGLQIYDYFDNDTFYFKNKSIIIKNTNISQSISQKQNREKDYSDNLSFDEFEKRSYNRLNMFKQSLLNN